MLPPLGTLDQATMIPCKMLLSHGKKCPSSRIELSAAAG